MAWMRGRGLGRRGRIRSEVPEFGFKFALALAFALASALVSIWCGWSVFGVVWICVGVRGCCHEGTHRHG